MYTDGPCFTSAQTGKHRHCQNSAVQVVSPLVHIPNKLMFLQSLSGPSSSVCMYFFSPHSSLLKEPVPESLMCLCALGLFHGDVTLASAALSELLKLEGTLGSAVEERCLLTCTLLAVQGKYNAVQREISRAVFRYVRKF